MLSFQLPGYWSVWVGIEREVSKLALSYSIVKINQHTEVIFTLHLSFHIFLHLFNINVPFFSVDSCSRKFTLHIIVCKCKYFTLGTTLPSLTRKIGVRSWSFDKTSNMISKLYSIPSRNETTQLQAEIKYNNSTRDVISYTFLHHKHHRLKDKITFSTAITTTGNVICHTLFRL